MHTLRAAVIGYVTAFVFLHCLWARPIGQPRPGAKSLVPIKMGFEVSLASEVQATEIRTSFLPSCTPESATSMECTVFHFAMRNLGSRPIRKGTFSCSDASIVPEYRTQNGTWKQLEDRLMSCNSNVYIETPILPGKNFEGDFALGTLAPHFDISPLSTAGKYQIRFRLSASVCAASADGSACLHPREKKKEVKAISKVVTIDATASPKTP
jgi:hypothetical protein